jgi:hypothetical protein
LALFPILTSHKVHFFAFEADISIGLILHTFVYSHRGAFDRTLQEKEIIAYSAHMFPGFLICCGYLFFAVLYIRVTPEGVTC